MVFEAAFGDSVVALVIGRAGFEVVLEDVIFEHVLCGVAHVSFFEIRVIVLEVVFMGVLETMLEVVVFGQLIEPVVTDAALVVAALSAELAFTVSMSLHCLSGFPLIAMLSPGLFVVKVAALYFRSSETSSVCSAAVTNLESAAELVIPWVAVGVDSGSNGSEGMS